MFALRMQKLLSPTINNITGIIIFSINKPFSSLKLSTITENKAWKGGPMNFERLSPATRNISKFYFTGTANAGVADEESVTQLPEGLRPELMPKHVAIITDGNGRWARHRGVPIEEGHRAGSETMKQIIVNCSKYGIKVLTAFAFSTENWRRSKVEVDILMSVIEGLIDSGIMEQITRINLRFSMIGDRSRLPASLQQVISRAEKTSIANKGMHLVMGINYGGQCEIIEATKKVAAKVENGILRAKDINQSLFEQQLMTNLLEHPNPDLLIRTSGELRLSNFLLWQLAYTELYFTNKMFPDFQEADLIEAFRSFQGRQRRVGARKN